MNIELVVEKAKALARKYEGLSLKPYVCPAGFWTIGYGHLCSKDQKAITKREAEILLTNDVEAAMRDVVRLCPILLTEHENKLAAITDFVFNLGAGRLAASTLLRRLRSREWSDVPTQLRKWIFGGGRKLPGLVLRREDEALLFNCVD